MMFKSLGVARDSDLSTEVVASAWVTGWKFFSLLSCWLRTGLDVCRTSEFVRDPMTGWTTGGSSSAVLSRFPMPASVVDSPVTDVHLVRSDNCACTLHLFGPPGMIGSLWTSSQFVVESRVGETAIWLLPWSLWTLWSFPWRLLWGLQSL